MPEEETGDKRQKTGDMRQQPTRKREEGVRGIERRDKRMDIISIYVCMYMCVCFQTLSALHQGGSSRPQSDSVDESPRPGFHRNWMFSCVALPKGFGTSVFFSYLCHIGKVGGSLLRPAIRERKGTSNSSTVAQVLCLCSTSLQRMAEVLQAEKRDETVAKQVQGICAQMGMNVCSTCIVLTARTAC